MHTFEGKNKTIFHFDSDFSGTVYITAPDGTEIKVDGEDMEEFIEEIRGRRLESLIQDVEELKINDAY